MKKFLKTLVAIEKNPRRGLMALEWVVLAYMALTLLVILFTFTKMENPDAMVWGRVRIGAMTLALWIVYRLVPCRLTRFFRVMLQFSLLAWWYPDTYEINRLFPNLDHLFARWEQNLFGFQPALDFAARFPSHVVSELMDMGYAAYYPLIALTVFYYFLKRYAEFERAAFIVMGAFFCYYAVYLFLPVTGPTFYYKAIGLEQVVKGVFPPVHDYFNSHTGCLPSPGYTHGIFYQLVEDAKEAGERPTAAFPSSHVGISTVCMLLVLHARNYRLAIGLLPFYLFLCMATVYIQAHYAIDAFAGLLTGCALYYALLRRSKDMVLKVKS